MRGECVLPYDGKRGVVWRIRWRDAGGDLHTETLGREDEGWSRKKAQVVLEERRTDVRREGLLRPATVTFESFARDWLANVHDQRDHRRNTRIAYAGVFENHLIPHLGSMRLSDVKTRDVDAYVASKRRGKEPLAASTLNLHVTRLNSLFDAARRQGLIQKNPVSDAERPSVSKTRWAVLMPHEVTAVLRALDEHVSEATDDTERRWCELARVVTLTMLYAWLRRGEVFGLRWRDVELGHPERPRLHVRQAIVNGHVGKPKTDESERTIALAEPLADALWEHWQRTHFKADDDLVFGHPLKGSPLYPARYGELIKAALKRAGVERDMREFHDWRHTGITNAAAAGMPPVAIMRMAGHTNFATTQRYLDLADVLFGDEVARLGEWYGRAGTKSGYQVAPNVPVYGSATAVEPISS
jgi:integrase